MNHDLPAARRRRPGLGAVVRVLALVVALTLCVAFLVPRRDEIVMALGRQSPLAVVAALILGAAATYATFLSWRALLSGAGHDLPGGDARRMFFLSQIGKYLPGSIWPIVAQADLGRRHGVPPVRSVSVGLLTLLVSCIAGVTVAAVTLPFVLGDVVGAYWWVVLVVPLALTALHPRVLHLAVRVASSVMRRDLAQVRLRAAAVLRAFVHALVAWVLFGAHLAVLLAPLGATGARVAVLSVGTYALAWLVGFAIFFLPAGLGGREALLTTLVAAGTVLSVETAVSAAVVSRLLLSSVDVLAVLLTTPHRRPGSGTSQSRSVTAAPGDREDAS